MFWTGLTRPSESVLKEQDERNIENIDTLIEIRDQAKIMSKLLLKNEISIKKIGNLISEGWNKKKKLSSRVSNSIIDQYYKTALKNGAYGGKISGAGGGGFLTLVAEQLKHDQLNKAMQKLGLRKYSFGLESGGTEVIQFE